MRGFIYSVSDHGASARIKILLSKPPILLVSIWILPLMQWCFASTKNQVCRHLKETGYIMTDNGRITRAYKSTYKRHGTLNLFVVL